MNVALLVTLGVGAVGGGVGLWLALHDWRAYRAKEQALARATAGTLDARRRVVGTHRGRPFVLSLVQRPRVPALVRIALPGDVPHELLLSQRDFFERLAEGVGLSAALRTGDAGLDERLVILTEAPSARALLADAAARSRVKELFDTGLESLHWSLEARALVAEFVSRGPDAEDGSLALAVLEQLTAPLPGFVPPPSAATGAQSPAAATASPSPAPLLMALGSLALGVPCAVFFDVRYPPLERGVLLAGASALTALGTVCLGWLAWRVLRRSTTGYRHWLPMMPVLAAGIWTCSYALLAWSNGALDHFEPRVTVERVAQTSRQPRGGTFDHRVHTATGTFDVSPTLFGQLGRGSPLTIVTHPGRLGVPWRRPSTDIRVADSSE